MPEFQNRERSSENKLVVRRETLPARCEICHQSDMLDLESGICRRCESVPIPTSGEGRTQNPERSSGWRLAAIFFLMIFLFAMLCGGTCSFLGSAKDPIAGLCILALYSILLFFTILRWLQTNKPGDRGKLQIFSNSSKTNAPPPDSERENELK
jgi:hypothetical protein